MNKNVFAAWCGMIIGGYDLYDKDDKEILSLCNQIKNKLQNDKAARHFALSKTNTIECNPYYPRASDLSVYCFYMDKPIDEYYRFLDDCGDTEHKHTEFQKWIKTSKNHINAIINNKNFAALFGYYVHIINQRFDGVDSQINSVKRHLDKHFAENINILFAPNLLQSKYLADYVLADNKLYIIAAEFSEKTVIHEYLHIIAKSKRQEFEKVLQEKDINYFVNVDEMQKLGFLKNFSIESKVHTLEEQFVRYYTNLLTK